MKNDYSGNDELGWGFIAMFAAILISGSVLVFAILI